MMNQVAKLRGIIKWHVATTAETFDDEHTDGEPAIKAFTRLSTRPLLLLAISLRGGLSDAQRL